MVLVDTSIWVSHFRDKNLQLEDLLTKGQIVCHPYVIGELACGNLKNRNKILWLLRELPMAAHASQEEILIFIEDHQLMGLGLGYIDVHLLASALLSTVPLWTKDRRLKVAADQLHISFLY
ncbi:type II toxin-antitoxin system VapC family toxin [Acidobacteriota bacterium]